MKRNHFRRWAIEQWQFILLLSVLFFIISTAEAGIVRIVITSRESPAEKLEAARLLLPKDVQDYINEAEISNILK